MLRSFYKYPRTQIPQVLHPLVTDPGVVMEDADLVLRAVKVMAIANVDFLDAFLPEMRICGIF